MFGKDNFSVHYSSTERSSPPSLQKTTTSSSHAHRWSNSSLPLANATLVSTPLAFFPWEIVQVSVLASTFFISFCGNGILLFAIWKKAKNSSGAWLLFSLVLVNFINTLLVCPWEFLFFLRRNVDPFAGDSRWQFFGRNAISSVLEWCTRFSWMLVGLISVDRFCAIVRAMTYQKDFPIRLAKKFFWGIFWGHWVLAIGPFVLSFNADFHPNRRFCTIQRRAMYGYFVLDLLFFVLPFSAMLYCWGRIFSLAWSKRLKVYIGNIAQMPPDSQTTATDFTEKNNGSNPTMSVLTFFHRSTSKDSVNSGASSNATSRKPSATAFVYNRTHKALITVSLILGSFILTAGIYTVSLLLEVFDTSSQTMQPWWFYNVADCAMFASPAVYPFIYGFLHRQVRRDIYVSVRSLFGYGPSSAATLPRRWSISSHIMDYLPASRSHSRRTSADDVLGGQQQRRRRSSTSEESDAVSDTSFFHNFLRVKASRRRESAPSRLQNSVLDTSGIILTLAATNASQTAGGQGEDISTS